jgi:hypothetical protein
MSERKVRPVTLGLATTVLALAMVLGWWAWFKPESGMEAAVRTIRAAQERDCKELFKRLDDHTIHANGWTQDTFCRFAWTLTEDPGKWEVRYNFQYPPPHRPGMLSNWDERNETRVNLTFQSPDSREQIIRTLVLRRNKMGEWKAEVVPLLLNRNRAFLNDAQRCERTIAAMKSASMKTLFLGVDSFATDLNRLEMASRGEIEMHQIFIETKS